METPADAPITVIPPLTPCPPIPRATGPVDLILPPLEKRIHNDPKADKAAASMNVGIGHMSDPDDLPGCAHFCEHLLFHGTKTHPQENGYKQYLSSHNGSANAYTALASTNYFFDVSPNALEGALDHFAGFFIEPLFNEDSTEREIRAVDSEHKKNCQDDEWRSIQLERSLSKAGHPYGKFGTGNFETLWVTPKAAGRNPRKELIAWWENEYCARRMKLVIAGKNDVDTLAKWVQDKFANIPVRTSGKPRVGVDGERVVFENSPYGPEQVQRFTYVRPVMDLRKMEILFPFPDIQHLYQTKPANLLSHLIGHEGRGSIMSYLKARGWANKVDAGTTPAAGFSFFRISVDLTPEGLLHHKEVVVATFKYIKLLCSQPLPTYVFDELKRINDISFRFAEQGNTCSYCRNLSARLQLPIPREKVISSKWLLEEFRADEVDSALVLLDPRSSHIVVSCRELPDDVEGQFEMVEPIYGIQFKTVAFDHLFLRDVLHGPPTEALALPPPNRFIPEKLEIRKSDDAKLTRYPVILRETPISRLWYKQDDTFGFPRTILNVTLHSPIINNTARNSVLSSLFCELFPDSITEDTYDATLAGLKFSITDDNKGLEISISGFSDNLALLTQSMIERLASFKVDKKRFQLMTDHKTRSTQNKQLRSDPFESAHYWALYATLVTNWTHEEQLRELESITADNVTVFGEDLFGRLHIETLIHGNSTPDEAKNIQVMIESALQPGQLSNTELERHSMSLKLPPSSEHIWHMFMDNEQDPNSAVYYHCQIGDPADIVLRNSLYLFAQMANEACFNTLRTQEQLGYIVISRPDIIEGIISYTVFVQGERDPVYLELRMEAFLESMGVYVQDISDDEFEKHKQSLIDWREEKPKRLSEENERFWETIRRGAYDFARREIDVATLRKTSKEDVLHAS
ncbi:hypothetical protein L198_02442 [Cryptococcus wingfieldii CBS 7118]|uniref:Insulysin n=1 Tax=Cryptococcus wingfieldii CBS 7118 TaxID=1295528 RepID=A0A1E3JRZ0_9TREE|nr:hypothetical protein L198_02442 [Cryptococcus wingfieldii CBS 7118]ODO03593.1 hypothetical protein L198_02442 [Cryptococcus wingfieldii CBS 7118]